MWPEALNYIHKSAPVPATPTNMTAPRRLILPDPVSPLHDVYDIDSGDEDDKWEGCGLPANLQAETHQQPPVSPRLEPLPLPAGPALLEPLHDQLRQLGHWTGALPAEGGAAPSTTGLTGALPAKGGAAPSTTGLPGTSTRTRRYLAAGTPGTTNMAVYTSAVAVHRKYPDSSPPPAISL